MPSGGSSSRVAAANLNLPAGFRFHPTDEELIVHYLMNQAASIPCPVPIIAEVNIYQCNPWDLPAKALFGENEWYFFSPRDRKYPNGVRPNRAAGSGYWKATGTDKAILSTPTSQNIGVKKALVFYGGKPPRGVKTDWIMHEYRLTGTDDKSSTKRRAAGSSSMRLDDWVLCRIHKKSNDFQLSDQEQEQEQEGSTVEELDTLLINDNTITTFNNMNDDSAETTLGVHHEQQLHHQTMMSKSCSLTDLLNSIDYAAMSQMFLLDGPAAEAEPPQLQSPPQIYPPPPAATQTTTHQSIANNYDNSVTNNSSHVTFPTAAVVDAVISSDNSGVKKRKRVMAVDAAATAESSFDFDDGSSSFSSKKPKLPSDSRIAGHFGGFGTTTSSYCNNQQQLVDSSGFHQYSSLLLSSSNPFLNEQQLLLNSHIRMQ